jgi:hypothetical protein
MTCNLFRALLLCLLSMVGFAGCGSDSPATITAPYVYESVPYMYESVPEWARTGNFSFARWDGGPLEVSKGVLSGWPGFVVPDPQVIYATTHLYDPATVELLERAHVNWIWVTWSSGFSNQTEAAQQALLRKYIDECHRHGIHVSAYISIANIFAEDMFAHVPESRDWLLRINGQPVPYGTADYGAVGQVTRYLADLSLEAWQEYTLGRVIAAVDAGADGIMFDNSSSYYSRELMEQFTARALFEARKKNPQVLLSSNYGRNIIIAARTENALTSEQGSEPGIFDSPGPTPDRWNSAQDFISVSGGLLVLNVGLLRTLWAVSQGFRPVAVEYGTRHSGDRFLNTLPPAHQKLALAECAAFHAANEQFHESTTLRELFFGEEPAIENWDVVAQYNAFFQKNAQFYQQPISFAGTAVIVDTAVTDIAFLDELAARNLIYDVVFEQDATPENLERYQILIAAPAVPLRSGWRRYEDVTPAELEMASPGSVTAPDSVVVNIHGQSHTSRMLVHLLNYADTPVLDINLKVHGRFSSARLFSPDIDARPVPVSSDGQSTQIQVPELRTYDLVVLEP